MYKDWTGNKRTAFVQLGGIKMKECKHYDNWCEKEKRTCNNCYYERGYNMTDEEKKAVEKIDYIQDFIIENGQYNADVKDIKCFSTIKNLIEKQSKEIEELKEKNEYLPNWVSKKYVSKDKIKAKIEECRKILYSFDKELVLKANKDKFIHKESMNCLLGQISILQSLLEEEC